MYNYKINKANIQLTLDNFVSMNIVGDGYKLVSNVEFGGLGYV